ncbi:MAG: AAA-like domain-containing protein [Leptolyngbyaceae cyanobacterium MO_188.B28]|nr:AAA-like domain-containing protein [Leptolyngbyaceae cyanobacterium MO_188.B28]
MTATSPVKTILILAANPKGTTPRRLDEEVREIEAGLRRAQQRDRFIVKQRWATRALDIQRAILDENPQIVHFCGHGADAEGLVLEDNAGQAKPVSSKALAGLFELLSAQVDCVLLNGCYSKAQGAAIARHIETVIGINQAIGDGAAIQFAISFYDALGAGRDMAFAYQWGCAAIEMAGIDAGDKPVLLQSSRLAQGESEASPGLDDPGDLDEIAPASIFISYKRDVEPDEGVALALHRALGQQHTVVIDQAMQVGMQWAEWIDAQIRQSDFLIVLLSEASVASEMVRLEVEKAHQLAQLKGRPQLLPVRLAYREPFQYPLSEYLNRINWAFWREEGDTLGLIDQLQQAIEGNALPINSLQSKAHLLQINPSNTIPRPAAAAQPRSSKITAAIPLELPEGTIDLESQFYVEREADRIALDTIQRQGVTITIKGPRQMGKSSLLIRTMDAAMQAGKRAVFLDFQLFDKAVLESANRFFPQFCNWLTDELNLEDKVTEYWQRPLGNSQRCTRYMGRYLLKRLNSPLVLAMDEVECIFDTEFRSDFFGMLRSWHNQRATNPLWKQLDLVLVTSTEPYQLIDELSQSPFNVGQVLRLSDFTPEQVHGLNEKHGLPLNPRQEQQLMDLVNGHPYLVRKMLYLLASQMMTAAEVFARASDERGPFGDHLKYHLFRIYDKQDLVKGLLQVIRKHSCPDERVFFRLQGAGLIRREHNVVVPRCQLYEAYFLEHLHG